jgi:hypothetical protein
MFLEEKNQLILYLNVFKDERVDKLNNLFNDECFIKYFGTNHIPTFQQFLKKSSIKFEEKFDWNLILYCNDFNNLIYVSDTEKEKVDKLSYREKYNLEEESYTKPNYYDEILINVDKEYFELNFKNDYEEKFNKHYIDYRTNYYKTIVEKYGFTCNVENIDEYQYQISIIVPNSVLCCNIEPNLTDNYPYILRKIKEQIDLTNKDKTLFHDYPCKKYILMVETFNSKYTSKEQLISIFNQSNIIIIFITDEIFPIKVYPQIEPIRRFSFRNKEILLQNITDDVHR